MTKPSLSLLSPYRLDRFAAETAQKSIVFFYFCLNPDKQEQSWKQLLREKQKG